MWNEENMGERDRLIVLEATNIDRVMMDVTNTLRGSRIEARRSESSIMEIDRTQSTDYLDSNNGFSFNDTLCVAKKNDMVQKSFDLPQKQNLGTLGRMIYLRANHFKLSFHQHVNVNRYSIKIRPSTNSKKFNRLLFFKIQSEYPLISEPSLVYDGDHNVYTKQPLPIGTQPFQATVKMEGNYSTSIEVFCVTIQFEDMIPLSRFDDCVNSKNPLKSLEAMHAVDTILRHSSSQSFTVVMDSFFSTPLSMMRLERKSTSLGWMPVDLGMGREVCYGFYQSVSNGNKYFSVNMDVATTTFYRPMPVIDFLADILEIPARALRDCGRHLNDGQKRKCSKEITNLKVETRHCSSVRRYRVSRLSPKPMQNIMLRLRPESGQEACEISVMDYFQQRYGIVLQYPHLPCIVAGQNKDSFIPLELCHIVPGQRCSKKLTEKQISQLIRSTSKNAKDREDLIYNIVNTISLSEDTFAKQYGIKVDKRMENVEGRILPPPKITYKDNANGVCVANPTNGVWDLRNKKFFKGIPIETWAVISFAETKAISEVSLREFLDQLIKVGKDVGLPFVAPASFCKYSTGERVNSILEYIAKTYSNIQIVVCIIPGKSSIYSEVKATGDRLRLTTQCIRQQNVLRPSTQTLSNLCMKINAKLGGVNSHVTSPSSKLILNEPVLFIGCHLANNGHLMEPTDSTISSVVGSCDGYPSEFCSTTSFQHRLIPEIVDLKDMAKQMIKNFYMRTSFKPQKIIVYRNGVPPNKEYLILQYELRALREACISIDPDYNPGITFISVNVNHHHRLFPVVSEDAMGNSGNVPAGTVVDSGIISNSFFDFYLVSHAGVQGTSRPTKYQVLWDDNKFTADIIQEITYHLCHTNVRCTRAVSVPTPVFYAQLVAQRTRLCSAEAIRTFNRQENLSKSMPNNGMYFA